MQCYYLLAFLFFNPSLFSFPGLTISYTISVSGESFSLHFLDIKSVVLIERLVSFGNQRHISQYRYYFLQEKLMFILQIII